MRGRIRSAAAALDICRKVIHINGKRAAVLRTGTTSTPLEGETWVILYIPFTSVQLKDISAEPLKQIYKLLARKTKRQ
ncbi:hypothetical protein BM1_09302 [Bipolaris maydis]|nr:hypothetical protein BM1_09302 [Bipolaris maydis]